jgi:hypothetical protein
MGCGTRAEGEMSAELPALAFPVVLSAHTQGAKASKAVAILAIVFRFIICDSFPSKEELY